MDDLKDEIAHDEKRGNVKTVLLYSISIPIALLSGWGIVTSLLTFNNESDSVVESIVQKPVYPHTELGNRCVQAVNAYNDRIRSMEQDLADFSVRTADDMAAISQQGQAYQDELYSSASESGPLINRDSVIDAAEVARQTVSDGLDQLNSTASEAQREMRGIIDEEKERRDELAVCVQLVQQERDIPDYKVTEYEGLMQ